MKQWTVSIFYLFFIAQLGLAPGRVSATESSNEKTQAGPVVVQTEGEQLSPAESVLSPENVVLVEETVQPPTITPDELIPTEGFDEIQFLPGVLIRVASSPFTELQQQEFEAMSPEKQKRFNEIRLALLQKVAQVLKSTRFGFGSIIVAHERVSQFVPSKRLLRNAKAVALNPLSYLSGSLELEPRPDKTPKVFKTMSEANQRAAVAILNGINNFLWERPRVIVEQNEIGFMVSIGLQAQVSAPQKSIGGSAFLNLKIGFNHKEQALIFELSRSLEKFKSGYVINFGTQAKGYFYAAHRNPEDEKKVQQGINWYPPAPPVPFVGYGFDSSPKHIAGGYLFGAFAAPGDFAALLNYVNYSRAKNIITLRIKHPKHWFKKKPRPSGGIDSEPHSFTSESIFGNSLADMVYSRFQLPATDSRKLSCQELF